MITDAYTKVSSAQALTTATAVAPLVSTSSIDLQARADIGGGRPLRMAFNTVAAFVPGVGSTVITGVAAAVTVTSATPGVVSLTAHALPVGTPVIIADTTTTVPTNLVIGTVYYVTNPASGTFQLASSLANAHLGTGLATASTGTAVKITVLSTLDFQVIGADDAALTTGIEVLGTSGPIAYRAARRVVSFTVSGYVVAHTAHGLSAGTPVTFSVSGSGAMPAGLTAGVTYYVILGADADKLVLASTRENALAGIADVTFSDTGTLPIMLTVADRLLSAGGPQVYVECNPQTGLHKHKRYVGARYVTNSSVFAGSVTAQLLPEADQGMKKFPSGYTV